MVSQDEVLKFLDTYAQCWYLVLETKATRPHYQAYVRFKDKYRSLQSMRNNVKKILTGDGNRAYSCSELREEPYVLICYLMKESNLISKHNLLKEWITQAEARQEEIKTVAQKQSKKKPQTVLAEIMETLPPGHLTRYEIAKFVGAYFLRRKKLIPDPTLFKKYIWTIQVNRDPKLLNEYLIEEVFRFDQSPPTLETQAEWSEFFSQDEVSQ